MEKLIEDISFELSIHISYTEFDYENLEQIDRFILLVEDEYKEELAENTDAQHKLQSLKNNVLEKRNSKHSLSKDDLKRVYMMMRNSELKPRGEFDKAGRFWINDSELLESKIVPSVKYPLSQMRSAINKNFIMATANKYSCETFDSLVERFYVCIR